MPRKFVAYRESFLWTEYGIIKANEVAEKEWIYGVNSKGSHSLNLIHRKKIKNVSFIRLIMEQGESIIGADSWVFTTRGPMRGKDVIPNTVVELTAIPMMGTVLNNKEEVISDLDGNQYELNTALAYVIGLQKRIKKVEEDKVRFFIDNEKDAIQLAKITTLWLEHHYRNDQVLIRGNKILVKSRLIAEICRLYEDFPPKELRNSPRMLLSYLRAMLESSISIKKNEKIQFTLEAPPNDRVFSRFIITALRRFGIIAERIGLGGNEISSKSVKILIKEADFKKIISGKIEPYVVASNYSTVKEAIKMDGEGFYFEIQSHDEHWSPIIDLLPIHALP